MFCKWCGGNLAQSETKCKRCGKEIQARSDCGGFYDLVPADKKQMHKVALLETAVPSNGVRQQHSGEIPERGNSSKKASEKKKKHGGIWRVFAIVVLCCLATLFAQLRIVHGAVVKQSGDMSGMKEDLQGMIAEIQAMNKGETESAEDLEELMEPELKVQDISLRVMVAADEDVDQYFTEFDLGDYSDTVSVAYTFDKATGTLSGVQFDFQNAEGDVGLRMDQRIEDDCHKVSVSYETEGMVFGIVDKPAEFRWLYRIDRDETVDMDPGANPARDREDELSPSKHTTCEWAVVPESEFYVENGEDETSISIETIDLQELVNGDDELLELKCEILLENIDGGSLALSIEGITFSNIQGDDAD